MSLDQARSIPSNLEYVLEDDREEDRAVALAIAGDHSATDWLITRYRSRAVRLAMHMLQRSGEAEDAAQEAFIRAFQNLSEYRRDGKFYTWLYRIVVRVCLDRRRQARWSREVELDCCFNHRSSSNTSYDNVELMVVVEQLMGRLTPQMRAMLVLRELDGLEYTEIAQVLQIPVGRVRWRLHTARKQFQALWTSAQQETNNVS